MERPEFPIPIGRETYYKPYVIVLLEKVDILLLMAVFFQRDCAVSVLDPNRLE